MKKPRTLILTSSLAAIGVATAAQADPFDLIRRLHPSRVVHVTQAELNTRSAVDPYGAFIHAFEVGDELFEVDFTAADGGGAKVGNGTRTTRMPRADLDGPGEWAQHVPARATGPNGSSCISCHLQPVSDGAGGTAADVHRDPFHTGDISQMIHRNTPHLHGMGAVQRVAEEMTEDLHAQRDAGIAEAQRQRGSVVVALETKGVRFGQIVIQAGRTGRTGRRTAVTRRDDDRPAPSMSRPARDRRGPRGPRLAGGTEIDYSGLEGIDEDLVVKPFQWKGTFPSVRAFNLDAMHNELGVQPREILADGVDGDGDGVVSEATVGDMTAMTIYLAAQPRPTTRVELGQYGMGPAVPAAQIAKIDAGEVVFAEVGCANCHVPQLPIEVPIFSEPSTNSFYRDETFPGGQDPVALGLSPNTAIMFDLTADPPNNRMLDSAGNLVVHLGALESDGAGGAILRAYGDMKRHDLGPQLAEAVDEAGTGASVFMTENLWGVGVTAPYLHDGRATTLTEAIQWHGGEAASSRGAFERRSAADQSALIAFLENMVIFLPNEP